jgi:hypothetical protein
MILSDESYTMILVFSIVAIILSIIILLCFRYHDMISNICRKNQVAPETVYMKKPLEMKLEIKPV